MFLIEFNIDSFSVDPLTSMKRFNVDKISRVINIVGTVVIVRYLM